MTPNSVTGHTVASRAGFFIIFFFSRMQCFFLTWPYMCLGDVAEDFCVCAWKRTTGSQSLTWKRLGVLFGEGGGGGDMVGVDAARPDGEGRGTGEVLLGWGEVTWRDLRLRFAVFFWGLNVGLRGC